MRQYARTVYVVRSRVTKAARGRIREMERCAVSADSRRRMKRDVREYRRYRTVTPYEGPEGDDRSAIKPAVVMCESGGDYHNRNGSTTAAGRYQILDSTFHANGGRDYPGSHDAAQASKLEQHEVAHRIWADPGQGPGAWVCKG